MDRHNQTDSQRKLVKNIVHIKKKKKKIKKTNTKKRVGSEAAPHAFYISKKSVSFLLIASSLRYI